MKRYALFALVLVLSCTLFTGCRRKEPNTGMTTPTTMPTTQTTHPTTEPTVPMTTEHTTERPTDSLTEAPTEDAKNTTTPTARGIIQDPAMR